MKRYPRNTTRQWRTTVSSKRAVVLLWLTIAFCVPTAAVAEEFCAVTVLVVDNAETPLRVPLRLTGPDGKIVAVASTDKDGRASFCDFGFGDHSIEVYPDALNSVMIRRVRLAYLSHQDFKVILTVPKYGGERAGDACLAYFRVASASGHAGSGVLVQIAGQLPDVKTDTYGRALRLIDSSAQDTAVTFSGPRYETQTIHISCAGRFQVEQLVVMKLKEKRP